MWYAKIRHKEESFQSVQKKTVTIHFPLEANEFMSKFAKINILSLNQCFIAADERLINKPLEYLSQQ